MILMLAALALAVVGRSATAQPADERTRVEAVVRAAFASSEAGNLGALDSLYTTDATIIEGSGLDRGWANYRDHHLAPELKEFTNFRYRPSDIEVTVDGGTAWVMLRYTLTATMGERQIDSVGRGTMILRLVDGKWRIRHSHTSGRARRATDAP
jgi:uncharacterized protein (TIGR02246 family)